MALDVPHFGLSPDQVNVVMLDQASQLIADLTDSLQETRILAVVGYEGDPVYAQEAGLDAISILTRARDALGDAEEYKEYGSI